MSRVMALGRIPFGVGRTRSVLRIVLYCEDARGLPPKARGAFSEGSENPFGIGVHEDFLKPKPTGRPKPKQNRAVRRAADKPRRKCPADLKRGAARP
jgi:hypothetical protein